MDLTNIITKDRTQGDILSNCYHTCKRLINQKFPNARMRKVINLLDPFGNTLGFLVKHKIRDYKIHYVLEENENIIDPFLLEEGPIPKKNYLQQFYKNPKELRIV